MSHMRWEPGKILIRYDGPSDVSNIRYAFAASAQLNADVIIMKMIGVDISNRALAVVAMYNGLIHTITKGSKK